MKLNMCEHLANVTRPETFSKVLNILSYGFPLIDLVLLKTKVPNQPTRTNTETKEAAKTKNNERERERVKTKMKNIKEEKDRSQNEQRMMQKKRRNGSK